MSDFYTTAAHIVPETASDERMHVLDDTCWCRPIIDTDAWRIVHQTAPTGTEATTARIAEVLAEHEPNGFSCACGWRNETATYATAHRAHVAALLSAGVIRDMQAAAWDEGHHEGCGCDGAMNPYRAARIEEQP